VWSTFRGTRWRRSLIQCAASCRTRILRPLIYLGRTPDLNIGKYVAEADFSLSPKRFVMVGSYLQVWVVGVRGIRIKCPWLKKWCSETPVSVCLSVCLSACLPVYLSSPVSYPSVYAILWQNSPVNCDFDSSGNEYTNFGNFQPTWTFLHSLSSSSWVNYALI
jgi:hypothetical protein